jgi:hypothetical protein
VAVDGRRVCRRRTRGVSGGHHRGGGHMGRHARDRGASRNLRPSPSSGKVDERACPRRARPAVVPAANAGGPGPVPVRGGRRVPTLRPRALEGSPEVRRTSARGRRSGGFPKGAAASRVSGRSRGTYATRGTRRATAASRPPCPPRADSRGVDSRSRKPTAVARDATARAETCIATRSDHSVVVRLKPAEARPTATG